jgi:hypothetical protein
VFQDSEKTDFEGKPCLAGQANGREATERTVYIRMQPIKDTRQFFGVPRGLSTLNLVFNGLRDKFNIPAIFGGFVGKEFSLP